MEIWKFIADLSIYKDFKRIYFPISFPHQAFLCANMNIKQFYVQAFS